MHMTCQDPMFGFATSFIPVTPFAPSRTFAARLVDPARGRTYVAGGVLDRLAPSKSVFQS